MPGKAADPPALMTLIALSGLSVVSLNMFLPSLANIAREFQADYALVNLCMVTFFLWRRGKRPVPANPAPFAAAATFSPTGAELRVTEDLRQAVQEHPPMVDALSGEPSPQCETR